MRTLTLLLGVLSVSWRASCAIARAAHDSLLARPPSAPPQAAHGCWDPNEHPSDAWRRVSLERAVNAPGSRWAS